MMKRLMIVAVLASTFAAPTVTMAEAGPLREKLKNAAALAKQNARGVVRLGEGEVHAEGKARRLHLLSLGIATPAHEGPDCRAFFFGAPGMGSVLAKDRAAGRARCLLLSACARR